MFFNFHTLKSTQDVALKLAGAIKNEEDFNFNYIKSIIAGEGELIEETAEENTRLPIIAISALNQTNGYGRLARTWLDGQPSNNFNNLFASFILPISTLAFAPALAPYYVALSVYNMLKPLVETQNLQQNLQLNLQLKWPNDILLENCKICGILIQSLNNFIVVGIGLNVISAPLISTQFAASFLAKFVNLSPQSLGAKYFCNNITNNFETLANTKFDRLIEKLQSITLGFSKQIKVNGIGGIFTSINKNGSISLLDSNKKIHNILFGDVGFS